MSTHPPAVVVTPRSRVAFIDLLRCLAAFQMIQGHTIAALLAPQYRHGSMHALWQHARGLTSVAFLFASGFAFYVTTWSTQLGRPRPGVAEKRVRRGAQLIALGYALHLPLALFASTDAAVRAAAVRGFVAVDVLQCIGVALIALQALSSALSLPVVVGLACAFSAVLLLGAAPFAAALPVDGAWAPLAAYLSPRAGSSFPLLPWAAHMFSGAACAAWLARPSAWPTHARLLLAAAGAFGIASGAHAALGRGLTADHVGRLSWVLLASAVLAQMAAHMPRVPQVVRTLAGNTLPLYVLHILIVYAAGVGLADRVGPRLSPQQAVGAALGVLAVTVGAVLGYERLRGRRLARTAATG